ncbi:transglycosylase SLT domain-containing protein [Acinetobacter johnsonii]|uniref:transglycosylase SLT domain-containing protein n=1 Tax=Acinetobacter johnsonii TaxID=40214 RepID=UPI00244BDC4F|nr:transglycosylase SLT domain-containing protein [Acinetobacter johnsonii]MDH1725054.1 transglycosylase SLT domain-containing protein [Acinetobacter johnsonii]
MATASLGRLTLDLVAKIGNFTGPMTKAERHAKNSSKGIAGSFDIAAMAATALGAAIAGISVGGLVALADQTIQTGSEIKKFSQLANTSVHDFQYYSKGAEIAGISIESFADKMKDMQDRIGDFQQTGGGPLADFFENIAPLVGVTIQQFQKLSGPEALQLYYDSLQKVGATQNDMKFYMEAIISDSSLLIPLLENGGEGFKKWGDAAERANAIMSDEMIENLALAKENVQLLNLQWDGLQATLINNVIPVVQTVADNMDNVKAVALALTAAIATKLIVQGAILAGTFTMAAIRAGVMEATLISLQGRATGAALSMGVLRGAMAFLGGPAGLAMLAVQGIAAGSAFLYMKKSSDTLDPSLSTQGKTVAELRIEYEKLDTTQQRVLTRKATDELNEANKLFREQKNELLGLIDAVTRNSEVSEKDRDSASRLFEQYRLGKINSNELATAVNSLATVSDTTKSSIDKKAESVGKEKSAVDDARRVLGIYSGKVQENTRLNNENAKSISAQEQALLGFTQKQREALKNISADIARENYIVANMAKGWSRDKANYFADARENSGMSFSETSSKAWFLQVEAGHKLQQQIKAREESEKKIEESNRKQVEYNQKNYTFTKSETEMLKRVAELNAKHNLNAIGAKYGIPENMLAAVMAQESKGNITAKSPTGAIGPFQTTSIYRKQHGLSVADSYNVSKSGEAAAKDLSKSYEIFGNWVDAATAYNAGIKGTQDLLSKGFTGSAAKTKEAREYAGKVDKWLVGLSGNTSKNATVLSGDSGADLKAWGEYWVDIETQREASLERQKNVRQMYFTEEERMAEDNKEALLEIQKAYAGDDSAIKEYTDKQKAAYQNDVAEFESQQKLKQIAEQKQLLEVRQNWMTAGDYAQQYYALVREEILNTANYSPEMKDVLIKQVIIQQGVEENAEREQVWGDYQNRFGVEESPYQQDVDLLDKALKQKLILEDEYQRKRREVQLTHGGAYAADFAGLMMNLVDTNDWAYRDLALAQKGFTLFSVAMSSYDTIAKAWSSFPFPANLPVVAQAVMQTGLLQAAVSAMTPAGFADGGFTGYGGKYDVAGVVHRGEGVLTQEEIAALGGPAGFYALREAIKNGYADGGMVLDPPKVFTPQNSKMDAYAIQSQQSSSNGLEGLTIINQIEQDDLVGGYFRKPAAGQLILNIIKANPSEFKRAMGV